MSQAPNFLSHKKSNEPSAEGSIGTVLFENRLRKLTMGGIVTLFTITVLMVFLMPFGYMVSTSVKDRAQIANDSILPLTHNTWEYEGPELPGFRVTTGQEYTVYDVPTEEGIRQMALVREGSRSSSLFALNLMADTHTFIDIYTLEIETWEGYVSTLEQSDQIVLTRYREDDLPEYGLKKSKDYPTYTVQTEDGLRTWAWFAGGSMSLLTPPIRRKVSLPGTGTSTDLIQLLKLHFINITVRLILNTG